MRIIKKNFNFILRTLLLISFIVTNQCSPPEKPQADVAPRYEISAADLFNAFSTNKETASKKYVNKIIEVTGPLASIQTNKKGVSTLFLLDDLFGISCAMDSAYSASNRERINVLSPGELLSIKGKCNGILTDVQLSGCVFVEPDQ